MMVAYLVVEETDYSRETALVAQAANTKWAPWMAVSAMCVVEEQVASTSQPWTEVLEAVVPVHWRLVFLLAVCHLERKTWA